MLEWWEAERFINEQTGGRTRPLIIECTRSSEISASENVDKDRVSSYITKRRMLVKIPSNEMTSRGMFSEVYGNLIAREFGVTTPFPALIHLGPDFVEAMQLSEATRHIPLASGIAVGCEYLSGLAPIIPSAPRNNEEKADVQAIYGVDLLLQNPDRRLEKPNCASYRGGILAFDFELAFSFLLPIIGKQAITWAVDQVDIHQNHLFYPELKRREAELDWNPFLKRLTTLTDERLTTLLTSTLQGWDTFATKVVAHFQTIRANTNRLEEALKRSLL